MFAERKFFTYNQNCKSFNRLRIKFLNASLLLTTTGFMGIPVLPPRRKLTSKNLQLYRFTHPDQKKPLAQRTSQRCSMASTTYCSNRKAENLGTAVAFEQSKTKDLTYTVFAALPMILPHFANNFTTLNGNPGSIIQRRKRHRSQQNIHCPKSFSCST